MVENSCNFREITLGVVSANLDQDDLQDINRIVNKYLIVLLSHLCGKISK
jgi:hypothetical protein